MLNGGPALPTYTPPRPTERGINGAPTVILNVETLAHLALIARFGEDWFRAAGTSDEPGSALVTVSGAVRRPGVFEIELGLPLADLLEQAEGDRDAQAYLIGGYFGTWLSASDARGVLLSNRSLGRFGAALGARAIVALPHDACGVVETARVARYLAEQGAGQCGPCLNGLPALAATLEQPRASPRRHTRSRLVATAALAHRGARRLQASRRCGQIDRKRARRLRAGGREASATVTVARGTRSRSSRSHERACPSGEPDPLRRTRLVRGAASRTDPIGRVGLSDHRRIAYPTLARGSRTPRRRCVPRARVATRASTIGEAQGRARRVLNSCPAIHRLLICPSLSVAVRRAATSWPSFPSRGHIECATHCSPCSPSLGSAR